MHDHLSKEERLYMLPALLYITGITDSERQIKSYARCEVIVNSYVADFWFQIASNDSCIS